MDKLAIEWLILLCFTNGGSTALAKLLLTAQGTIALHPNAEGQALVVAMRERNNRWNPEAALNYRQIQRRWVSEVRRLVTVNEASDAPPLVIEKSPPNICRYKAIVSMLDGMQVHLMAMTREPYATCASWNYRYGRQHIIREWAWSDEMPSNEDAYFEGLARLWLQRASWLDGARPDTSAFIRYEDFARHPAETIALLAAKVPRLAGVDPQAAVEVKDYPKQTIRDMNAETVSRLTERQKKAIMRGLSAKPELVAKLGYATTFEQTYPLTDQPAGLVAPEAVDAG
jgi:hypothetical protein